MTPNEPRARIDRAQGRDKKPSVGAVVVNFNGGDRILRAVEALCRQSYSLAQIIVVDNNSTDGSIGRVSECYPSIRAIKLDSNIGLSAARNVGLRSLTTTLAFIVDHDIYAADTAVESMVSAYLEQGSAIICPRFRLLPERDIVQMQGAAIHFLSMLILRHSYQPVDEVPDQGENVDAVTGGCLLAHTRTILEAGAFDDIMFFYFEDLELSLRLRLKGYRFWCEPRAEVFHEPAAGTPGLSYRRGAHYPRQRAYLTMRNRIFVILVNYRVRTILVLSPALVCFEVVALTVACSRGWPAEWFRAWYWQIRNLSRIRQSRRSAQSNRLCRDREVLVGGPLPLAPGFIDGVAQTALVALLSFVMNGYWLLTRRLIG